MSEEEVIKRRLIFDGDGTGEDRRLNVLLKMIAKWTKVDEFDEECQIVCDKILSQLSLVEHSRHRSEYVSKSNADQLQKYKTLYAEMEKNINTKKDEIGKQRRDLENAKVIKQNRIQYDLIAKAIANEPPRTIMNKKLKVLQRELADLAAEKKKLEQQLDSRSKQFIVLSTSSNALALLLNEDHKIFNEGDLNSSNVMKTSGPEPMSE